MSAKTKLLHLGGSFFQVPAIQCAKNLGCELLLADRDPQCPGALLADHFAEISTTDREGILSWAKSQGIDGIMTYASDRSAPTVHWVAKQLGLPGNPSASADLLQRKDRIRELQSELGLPHPDFRVLERPEDAAGAYAELGGIVLLKPVDASGSRGQSRVSGVGDLGPAVALAFVESVVGKVVMERWLDADIMELDGDLLIHDGEIAFRHYGHNYFPRDPVAQVPCGEIFPAQIADSIAAQMDQQFQALIDALGLCMGCMNFDALLCNGEVYLVDLGLRNGGNFVPEMIEASTGFPLTEAAVRAALGQSLPQVPQSPPRHVASYLLHSRHSGSFCGLEIDREILPYLFERRLFCRPGDHVEAFAQGNRVFGALLFAFPDHETLDHCMGRIEDLVHITVEGYTEHSLIE